MGSWKIRILALGLAGILAGALFWGAEAILWTLDPLDPAIAMLRRVEAAGTPVDHRSRREFVADLRARGIDAFPRLVPAALLEEHADGRLHSMLEVDGRELLPVAGLSSVTTVLCNETGRYAVYESDEHGFRNPEAVWPPAPVDLVLIGDSFTIGECVPPGRTIADGLRAEWARVMNLGYSGNSPLQELATLAEYGPRLAPGTTVWLFSENDLAFFDLPRSARSPLLMRYLEPGFSQTLLARQAEIDRQLHALVASGSAQPDDSSLFPQGRWTSGWQGAGLRDWVGLKRLRRLLSRLRQQLAPAHPPLDDRLLADIWRRADELVSAWDGELVVVFLPGVWNFDPNGRPPRWRHPDARRAVLQIARDLDLPLLDMQAVIERHEAPTSLYSFPGVSRFGSPHMNAKGYATTAEALGALLRDRLAHRVGRRGPA